MVDRGCRPQSRGGFWGPAAHEEIAKRGVSRFGEASDLVRLAICGMGMGVDVDVDYGTW